MKHKLISLLNNFKSLSHIHYAQIHNTHVLLSKFNPISTQNYEKVQSFCSETSRNSVHSDDYNFPFALKALAGIRDSKKGLSLHTQIVKLGEIDDVCVGNSLMSFYVSCDDLGFCRKVFDEMPVKDVVSWTVMMTGYRDVGDLDNALVVFEQMQNAELIEDKLRNVELTGKKMQNVELNEKTMINVGVELNRATVSESTTRPPHSQFKTFTEKLIFLIRNCRLISHIHQIQAQLFINNLYLDPEISHTFTTCYNYLITYHILYAQNHKPRVFLSNITPTIPLSHIQYCEKALSLYTEMNRKSVGSNNETFSFVLKALADCRDVKNGQSLHTQIVKLGRIDDIYVGNSLLSFYESFKDMGSCRKVFNEMSERDIVSWTVMMTGYRDVGDSDSALAVFEQMQNLGVELNRDRETENLENELVSLDQLQNMGVETNVDRDNEDLDNALVVFKPIRNVGVEPNVVTISEGLTRQSLRQHNSSEDKLMSFLDNCKSLSHIDQIQAQLIVHNLYLNTEIARSFIAACQSFNHLNTAHLLYAQSHNVFICNNLIRALSHTQYSIKALSFYTEMKRNSIRSNKYTFPFVFKALADLKDITNGQSLHTHVLKLGYMYDIYVGNSLLSVYASCRAMGLCSKLFDEMPLRDVVSWTVMMTGYRESKDFKYALVVFEQMLYAGVEPNRVTMVNALTACSGCEALEMGVWIHDYVKKRGWEIDVILGSSLIDMYGKCGRIDEGLVVFENMGRRVGHTWNTLIRGLALANYGLKAIRLFSKMEFEGTKPDEVTLIAVLSACSHNGLLQIGKQIFASLLVGRYKFSAIKKHYGCMVDLFARSGYLEEALRIINKSPFEPTITMWGALLAGCRAHGNLELAVFCAWKAIELKPEKGAFYAVLSNSYAQMGRWSDVEKVRSLMRERGFSKDLGSSSVDFHDQDHSYDCYS